MNKSVLYENIMSAISYSIKHSINEMARKSVNRTIDKKLWLTVSSIISRNRATGAENIKPIGSDKNNLLLRYVAALLIMKKPCPKSEKDIEDIKTFKLIGQKYLELGGTIADIKRLYNENTGDSSVAKVNDMPVQKPAEDNTEDGDSDWNSLFATDSDNDDLFSDVDSADAKNNEFNNSVLALAVEVDKDTPLLKIFSEITGKSILPRGMKLITPKKSDELLKIETNITQFSYLSKYNQIGKFILSFLNNWNIVYTNPLYLNLGESCTAKCSILNDTRHMYYSSGRSYNPDVFVPTVIINSNDTVDTIRKKQKENGSDHLFTDKAILAYLNDYHKTLNNITEPCIRKIMENNALLDIVYFSPDNGLMLYYCIEEILLTDYKNYGFSELSLTTGTGNKDIIIQYKGKIIITFTGKLNYVENIGYDNDNTISNAKDLRKKYKVFNKIFVKYAYNFKQLWGFDELHFKVSNGSPYCIYDFSKDDWMKIPGNAIIYSGFYKSKIKRANIDKPVKGSSITHQAWYQAISISNNVYIMKDTKDMCLFTLNFNDYSMIFELTNKGLELYNNILDGKIDIKSLD